MNESRLAMVSRGTAALVLAIGLWVLAARFLGVEHLGTFGLGGNAMKANAALCLALLGAALLALDYRGHGPRLAMAAAAGLALVTMLTLAENATGRTLIGQMLVRDEQGLFHGRMSPLAAIAFSIAATAVLLLSLRSAVAIGTAAWLGMVLALLGGVVVVGYPILRAWLANNHVQTWMALPTAVAIMLAGFATLLLALRRVPRPMRDRAFVRRRAPLFTAMTALAILAVMGWGSVSLMDGRNKRAEATRTVESMAHVLQEHAERTFDAAFMAVERVADIIAEKGFETTVYSQREWARMLGVADAAPQISSISIIDAAGMIRAISLEFRIEPLPVSQRDFFLVARDGGPETFIGGPFRSRLSGKVVVPVSRRLSDAEGRFLGVVMAAVESDYFLNFYRSLGFSDRALISVFRGDGTVIMREPPIEPGVSVGGSEMFAALAGARRGVVALRSPLDEVERLTGFRRSESHPILVVAALPVEEINSAWQSQAMRNSVLLLGVFAMLVLFTAWGLRDIHADEEAREKLAVLAAADPLTGLLNRRAFVKLAGREVVRARRISAPLAAIMIDADHFKRINDEYGHDAGDKVLVALGELCRHCLREVDVIGRLGGEEFAVVLPDSNLAAARMVAERLRVACAAAEIDTLAGSIRFTVSAGVAMLRPDESIDDLVRRADQALYEAKAKGRDRVEVADEVLAA